MTDTTSSSEALILAYLTGQATPEQIARYRERFAIDNGFRKTARELEIWLAPLDEGAPDVEPPPGLFDDIMMEIGKSDAVNAPPVAANDRGPAAEWKWKAIAAAASVLAALATGLHFVEADIAGDVPGDGTLMALLSDSSRPELMAVVYDPTTGRVVARLSNIAVPDDGDLQLWLIREGEAAPRSLGVLERVGDGQITFDIPAELRGSTDTLAVSLESLGGSRSAGPEGPILYTGGVSALPISR